MKILLSLLALLLLPLHGSAQAEGPCSNMAKYAAIRAYKAEMGTVQGSDGIDYSATLIAQRGEFAGYLVTISDNNEDGDRWEADYNVSVRLKDCKVVLVRKAAERAL